ncbi:MAG: hypothetical protein LBS91_05495 [Clostridiales Family XIII bacterium]|jgi:4-diphosphocytidyl-2-C-methyl-D-erythritol kinase|nr:hypothetical protein [Clostridiales Family XIII bacterium]
MLLKAPAKINLTLKILSKRADGYHEISSLMRAIRLFDEVEIVLRETKGDVRLCENAAVFASEAKQSIKTSCKPGLHGLPRRCAPRNDGLSTQADASFVLHLGGMPGVPDGPGNLAYRAAALMCAESKKETNEPSPFALIDITLKKRIPVAAGLAGGSADAAAVLLGLAKLLLPSADTREIAALGAALGADVPFCVYACAAANPSLGYEGAGAARAEGVGERLTLIPEAEKAFVVLAKPQVGVPTKEIYALFDSPNPISRRANEPSPFVRASDNDLEAVCAYAYPIVAETLARLKALCAEEAMSAPVHGATASNDKAAANTPNAPTAKVQLSGSGPTVFACFGDKAAATHVFARAKTAFPGMFVFLAETL